MEHNIDVMEGTRFPLCVTLKDGEGNALAGDGFRVYGGAVCPGMGAVAFPVTRSGGDFVVMVPGLAVGRMPWRYQVFVVEQATGVEWLLCSGEVRPEARCADASGGVAAGSLTVTGVLDKQTLSLGVQLGESTELCRSLVARAEEAARRAEEAAAGASFTLTAEEVQKVVPMKWGSSSNVYLSIGTGAKAYDNNALAIGHQANAGYSNTLALGYKSQCYGNYTIAIGHEAKAQAMLAISIGKGALASYDSAVGIGNGARAVANGAVSIGAPASVTGNFGVAIGLGARIDGGGSDGLTVGYSSMVGEARGTAVGAFAGVTGMEGVAVGYNAGARALKAVAVGSGARAEHAGAFVLGVDAVSKNDGEMMLKATNQEKGTSVTIELVPGDATGDEGSIESSTPFMRGDVVLTARDELSGRQHRLAIPLSSIFMKWCDEYGVVEEFGVVEGDGYGYGY